MSKLLGVLTTNNRFDLGEYVFFMYLGRIQHRRIYSAKITQVRISGTTWKVTGGETTYEFFNRTNVWTDLNGRRVSVKATECFGTQEELIEHLKDTVRKN